MAAKSTATRPSARTSGLVTKAVGDDLLIYDLERHHAHCLNRVAAAVWRQCDGRRDAGAIAASVRDGDGAAVPEVAVGYGLAELARARLLTGPVPESGVTRREWLRRLGATTALALPVVTSIVAPTAAHAQSQPCLDFEAPCTSTSQCCGRTCRDIGGCDCGPTVVNPADHCRAIG